MFAIMEQDNSITSKSSGRFLTALGAIGVLVILTTYMLEMVGGPWCSAVGVGLEYFWALAWLSLGVIAQLVSHWRHLMLATSLPGLIMVVILFFVPESPRWLSTVGRREEAEVILRKAAKINRRSLPVGWKLHEEEKVATNQQEKASFFELFK